MDPIFSDEDTFADDLLMFVLNEYSTNRRGHRNLKQLRQSSPFTSAIRFTIRKILEDHEVEIMNIFNSLIGYGNLTDNFKNFIMGAANVLVQRGYNEKEFIEFCAFIARLTTLCYLNNFSHCISLAATAIVELVKHFKGSGEFTKDSWEKLNRKAQIEFLKDIPVYTKQFPHKCHGCSSGISDKHTCI